MTSAATATMARWNSHTSECVAVMSDDETIFDCCIFSCVCGSVTRNLQTRKKNSGSFTKIYFYRPHRTCGRFFCGFFSFFLLLCFIHFSVFLFIPISFHLKHFLYLIGALFLLPRAIRYTLYHCEQTNGLNIYSECLCTCTLHRMHVDIVPIRCNCSIVRTECSSADGTQTGCVWVYIYIYLSLSRSLFLPPSFELITIIVHSRRTIGHHQPCASTNPLDSTLMLMETKLRYNLFSFRFQFSFFSAYLSDTGTGPRYTGKCDVNASELSWLDKNCVCCIVERWEMYALTISSPAWHST